MGLSDDFTKKDKGISGDGIESGTDSGSESTPIGNDSDIMGGSFTADAAGTADAADTAGAADAATGAANAADVAGAAGTTGAVKAADVAGAVNAADVAGAVKAADVAGAVNAADVAGAVNAADVAGAAGTAGDANTADVAGAVGTTGAANAAGTAGVGDSSDDEDNGYKPISGEVVKKGKDRRGRKDKDRRGRKDKDVNAGAAFIRGNGMDDKNGRKDTTGRKDKTDIRGNGSYVSDSSKNGSGFDNVGDGDMGKIVNFDNILKQGRRGFGDIGGGSMRGMRGMQSMKIPKIDQDKGTMGGGRGPNMKKIGLAVKLIIAAVIVIIIVGSSFYNVDEQHNAVVTQFGRVLRTDTAGLHFKVPLIQKVQMVDMTTHGVGIGYSDGGSNYFDTYSNKGGGYGISDSVMITSDFNLLDIDFYLEFKVSDPVAYLYNTTRPEEMLNNMAYAAIRSTVVNYTVDEAMTTGKSQIQAEIKEKIQQWLMEEEVGMQVVNVQIQDAEPPTATIQSAFKEVENAKQSKDTALNNARQYRNEQVPKAEAEADRILQNAEATKAARIAEAEGQASRFNTMFEQYQANPLITRQRLFYEAMEEVLPGKKVIFSDGSTQQLLPIDSFSTFTGGGANE